MRLSWGLNSITIRNCLMILTFCVSIISIITEYIVEVLLLGSDNVLLIDALNLFSVNLEESLPTWYSTILLFVASSMLFIIFLAKFRTHEAFRWHWLVLAIGFMYLSIDEGAAIHEIFVDPIQSTFDVTGFFAFGWQVVAIPAVLIVVMLYSRFMLHLPRRTLSLVIVSASFYLGGALIVEGMSANLWDNYGGPSMPYLALATIEETFEMLGAVLFIYTLLDYMEKAGHSLVIHLDERVVASEKTDPSRFPRVLLMFMLMNIALLTWMSTTRIPQLPADALEEITLPFYYLIEDQVLADDGVILDTSGVFGIDNPFSRQLAATLLQEYPYVIAISQPTDNLTTLIATQTLLITRDDLDILLHNIGQTNFIIFTTETVKAISQSP